MKTKIILFAIVFEMCVSAFGQNTGIGNVNFTPQSILHTHINAGLGNLIQLTNTTTGLLSTDGMILYSNGNDFSLNNREAGYLSFSTSNIERMRILSGGNVGIGTTASAYNLEIDGSFGFGDGTAGSYRSRTETRNDAGQIATQSGFYQTSAPFPAADWPVGAAGWWHLIDCRHSNNANNYAMQFAGSFNDQVLYFRKTANNAAQPWVQILTTANGVVGSGTLNYVPKWTPNGNTLGNSQIFDNGTNVGVGTAAPSYKLHATGDIYANGGWFRVSGNQGLFFQDWGGGFYMTDATWIRTYNNKNFYHNTGIMRTDGEFDVGSSGSRFLVKTNGQVSINNIAPAAGDMLNIDASAANPWAANTYNGLADGNCYYALSTNAANSYSTIEIDATTNTGAAVYGHNDASNSSANGVIGTSSTAGGYDSHGVDGLVPNTNAGWGYGGYFQGKWYAVFGVGDLGITGGKFFVIDHPLDPENKTLRHACIESNEILNMYRGNAICNSAGETIIELPDYFEAININYSYHLTPVGGFAQLYIKEKITNNKFIIAGGYDGLEVSWMVYAERNDKYVQLNPDIKIMDRNKKPNEIGKYHMPSLYGKPESLRIGYRNPKQKRTLEIIK